MHLKNYKEMKTIRTYLSGCTWCNATGMVKELYPTITGGWSQICPVCKGEKTIPITETIEDEIMPHNALLDTLENPKVK